jgi:hypothetical protein
MREFAGRHVYDRLEEIVAPKHTALLVVDMQNDFCDAAGVYAKGGADTGRIRAIPTKRTYLTFLRRDCRSTRCCTAAQTRFTQFAAPGANR